MIIILAIDPGTATTGYAILKKKAAGIELVSCGCITTPAKDSPAKRLLTISKDLERLITKYHPQELVVEQLFFAKNTTTAMAVGQARGVVLLAGAKASLEIGEYTPLQVKQAVTGFGQATKQQVQKMVKNILHLEKVPRPDDAADAIAVGLCHLQTKYFISKAVKN